MVTLLEVMITSQVTITSQEVIVTSPINEQMVEANEFFWHKNTCAMTQIEKEMQNVFSIMYEVKKKVFDRIQSFV